VPRVEAGGKLYISTPNTFSVDARLKYLVSGYFPRFRPLMQEPDKVLVHPIDDAQHRADLLLAAALLPHGRRRENRRDIGQRADAAQTAMGEAGVRELDRGHHPQEHQKRGFPDQGVTSDACCSATASS